MSTTPPTGPIDDVSKKELRYAIIWGVLVGGVAVYAFIYSGRVEPEKKGFYLIAGASALAYAAYNLYATWRMAEKLRKPPTKPQ